MDVPDSLVCLLLLLTNDWLIMTSSYPHDTPMKRHFLDADNALCNDGSKAGYYLKRNKSSDTWIAYLEGGWYCHNELSCLSRGKRSHFYSMMSSDMWSANRYGDGILHAQSDKNPLFWQVNHVYIPYCSSDLWTGNATRVTANGDKLHFHGYNILREVIQDLVGKGMVTGSRLVLAGSSAGAVGVIQNIDSIANALRSQDLQIDVRGIVDSGWFVDSVGEKHDCKSQYSDGCNVRLTFKTGVSYWSSILASSCTRYRDVSEQHRCLYGEKVFPTVTSPLFVVQYLYDSAQIWGDNKDLAMHASKIFQPKYINYITQLGERLRHSLKTSHVHGVFAPACVGHNAISTTNILQQLQIHGKSLSDALHCWMSTKERNERSSNTTQKRNERNERQAPSKSKSCRHKLVDHCLALQCNKNCPPITSPIDGTELKLTPDMRAGMLSSFPDLPDDQAQLDLDFLNRIMSDLQKG